MRILEVKTCRDCPKHFTQNNDNLTYDYSHYCNLGNGVVDEIRDPEDIPTWCPLPTKEQERDAYRKAIAQAKEAWGPSIFPQLSSVDMAKIDLFMCECLGRPLDALSAHIGRRLIEGIEKAAQAEGQA